MLNKDAARLKEELRELFRERHSKTELLEALAAKLNKFQQLKGTFFSTQLMNLLQRGPKMIVKL